MLADDLISMVSPQCHVCSGVHFPRGPTVKASAQAGVQLTPLPHPALPSLAPTSVPETISWTFLQMES